MGSNGEHGVPWGAMAIQTEQLLNNKFLIISLVNVVENNCMLPNDWILVTSHIPQITNQNQIILLYILFHAGPCSI